MPKRTQIELGRGEHSMRGSLGTGRTGTPTYNVTFNALCDLFRRLDRTIMGTNKIINVTPKEMRDAPSATDGTNIYLSDEALLDAVQNRDEDMMSLFGLNYHELSHVLYTPRLTQGDRTWLHEGAMRPEAFNLLEDLRIEHIIRQVYPRMTIYFLAAIYKYYYKVPDYQFNDNWFVYALVCERRYVPRPDRQAARDVMVNHIGERDTKKVEEIAAAYVQMTSMTSHSFLAATARNLVDQMAKILARGQTTGAPMKMVCKDASHDQSNTDKYNAQAVAAKYEEIDGDDGEPMDGRTKSQAKKGKGDGKDAKKKGLAGFSPTGDETAKLLSEAVNSSEIRRDLQLADSTIQKAAFKLEDIHKGNFDLEPVTGEMRRQRDLFLRELTQLQQQVDPGWETEQSSGRLNLNRAMKGDDPLTVFDAWEEDHSDALKIEAKLLADMSGSMSGHLIKEASKAFWIVSSALNKLDAKVDQIGYSNSSFQINPGGAQESDVSFRHLHGIAGTNPRVGIAKSRYDFENSDATNKLFVIYTDGSWHNPQDDADIKAMRDMGVTTVMILMLHPHYDEYNKASYNPNQFSHGAEHFFVIKESSEFTAIVRKLVNAIAKNSVASIGR